MNHLNFIELSACNSPVKCEEGSCSQERGSYLDLTANYQRLKKIYVFKMSRAGHGEIVNFEFD